MALFNDSGKKPQTANSKYRIHVSQFHTSIAKFYHVRRNCCAIFCQPFYLSFHPVSGFVEIVIVIVQCTYMIILVMLLWCNNFLSGNKKLYWWTFFVVVLAPGDETTKCPQLWLPIASFNWFISITANLFYGVYNGRR